MSPAGPGEPCPQEVRLPPLWTLSAREPQEYDDEEWATFLLSECRCWTALEFFSRALVDGIESFLSLVQAKFGLDRNDIPQSGDVMVTLGLSLLHQLLRCRRSRGASELCKEVVLFATHIRFAWC